MFDLAIHGSVYSDGLAERWVYVRHGEIARVSRERLGRADAEVQLGPSQFLLPAATDLHVHLRDWSQAQKETIETGTKSAVAGGVTTVAEMPNTEPELDSEEAVRKRVDLLHRRSFADFALHAAVPELLDEIPRMRRAGAFAVKLFPPELIRFPEVLKEAGRSGMKVAVHAEDASMAGTPRAPYAEGVAVEKVLRETGRTSKVRFAHISTSEAARALTKARSLRRGITVEVTPHHLFMSESEADDRIGVTKRVNPPLRSSANAAAMRRLMRLGAFDFYATDHAPHTVKEKFQGSPGFPALEFALPLFLSKVDDLALVVKMYCEAPAAYLGIKKGKIAPGYAADLVVMGRRQWTVDPETFHSKGRVTPFAGETLSFAVDHVFRGGNTVYYDGRFTRTPPAMVGRSGEG